MATATDDMGIYDHMGQVWRDAAASDERVYDLLDLAAALAIAGAANNVVQIAIDPIRQAAEGMIVGFVTGFMLAGRLNAENSADLSMLRKAILDGPMGKAFSETDCSEMTALLHGYHSPTTRDRIRTHIEAGCSCPRRGDCEAHAFAGGYDEFGKPITPRVCVDHSHYYMTDHRHD